jgi:glutathione synthase/RimK-type ligase-like ATP-grasp enzyme
VRELPEQDPVRRACRTWHEALLTFAELTPARVANRASAMASNASKPFQAQVALEAGFQVPETLVTNDPKLVLEFCSRHPRVIYKSTSGVRSIVQELTPEDLPRLGRIRWCPTQFQELVEGQDVRVHTVGSNAIATAVRSRSVDYRYAGRDGGPAAQLEPASLTYEVAERCVALAAALKLPFAGIDLRMAHDDRVICFEVNPSPAFSYYERQTGQPIARELALWLAES